MKLCNPVDQSQSETLITTGEILTVPHGLVLMPYFNWKSLMGIHGILAFLMDYVNRSLFIL